MRNNKTYKLFEQIATDGDYTILQVENSTTEQVETVIGVRGLSQTFVDNMKSLLIRRLQTRDDELDKQFFISKINIPALRSRFENIEFEKQRDDDKRIIIIHLDGK